MDRTDYINRVKKGIEFYETMEALEDDSELKFDYGTREFEIHCSEYNSNKTFSVGDGAMFGRRMNIDMDRSSKSFLYLYTFDLFNNKTVAKLYFEHIKIAK